MMETKVQTEKEAKSDTNEKRGTKKGHMQKKKKGIRKEERRGCAPSPSLMSPAH